MSAMIGHTEDDDLLMFALGLLTPEETAAVSAAVEADAGVRSRLAAVRSQMGAYLQSAVVLDEVPEQSLDRLMGRIAEERKVVPIGTPVRERAAAAAPTFGMTRGAAARDEAAAGRSGRVLPWVGWAAAAGLAVAAGTLYHERAGIEAQLEQRNGQVAQVSNETAETRRERDAMAASAMEQRRKIDELTAAQTGAQDALATAKQGEAKTAAQVEALRAEAARQAAAASGRATQVSQQAQQVSQLTAQLAAAEQQRSALQGQVSSQTATLASEQAELARLRTEAASAREVLDALTDRTALRVTLTKPKGKPEPTGRTTYVASRGTLVFQGNNLEPLAANKVYELWLLPADGGAPVPAGTFAPDARGNASLVTPRLAGAVAAKAFAITVENEGGATTPTMPILLVGAAG